MANPNQQLEAALAQFASQPGVTPDQVAQLRAAVTGNAQQLQELNQQAQSGQLRGFALHSGTNANLAGIYDIQSGTVTLPASSFQPSGTAASADLTATVKLQEMSIEFAHKSYKDAANNSHPVTQDMVNNLQSTINGSPVLADEIKKAVTTADPGQPGQMHLEHFDFVAPGFSAGGTYNGGDKTMRLPATGLQTGSATNPQGRYNADDMTFVLGHEIQHGFNHPDKMLAGRTFQNDTIAIAKSAQPVHDYTAPISNYIQAGRDDEAKAEIAGWNALLGRQKQIQPQAPELDLMLSTGNSRVQDFVQQDPAVSGLKAQPLAGLSFNQDGSLSMSAANVAAMGQHYFNKPDHAHAQPGQRSLGIGEKGTSDYPNYYGASAVEHVIAIDRQFAQPVHGVMPQMTINMTSAKLSEELLEKEGIDLRTNKTPQPYYDSSQTPAAQHHFDHTQDGSVNPAQDHQYVPVAPAAPAAPGRGKPTPDDPDHPDHAMLEQIRAGVRKIDDGLSKPYDDMSERISRGLLVACKDNREMYPGKDDYSLAHNALSRVDHVVLAKNGNIFAVQDGLDDPGNKRAFAPVEQLARTPVEQSDEKLQAANKNLAQDQVLTEQRELARQKEVEENAPRMTRGITMPGPGGDGGGGGDG